MQTDAEVAAIAAGLTKAQREAMLREGGSYRTANALYAAGLFGGISRDFRAKYGFLSHPTDLGLRVAQHLKQENANG